MANYKNATSINPKAKLSHITLFIHEGENVTKCLNISCIEVCYKIYELARCLLCLLSFNTDLYHGHSVATGRKFGFHRGFFKASIVH